MKSKQAKGLKRDFREVKRRTASHNRWIVCTDVTEIRLFQLNCFLRLPDFHEEHVPFILFHALALDADLARVDLHRPGEAGVEPLAVPVHGQTAV